MKVYEKIAAVTACLEHMAWAWYDCEALPPWLQELSGRWAIRWHRVNRLLDGTLDDYRLELEADERRSVETPEPHRLLASA
jgi:hypothetical protein